MGPMKGTKGRQPFGELTNSSNTDSPGNQVLDPKEHKRQRERARYAALTEEQKKEKNRVQYAKLIEKQKKEKNRVQYAQKKEKSRKRGEAKQLSNVLFIYIGFYYIQ